MEQHHPTDQHSQKVVFIAGLTHSGSTLLDLILGSHEDFVGLGEVVSLLRLESEHKLHDPQRLCSCGHVLSDCVFWSHITKEIKPFISTDIHERYTLVLKTFREVFGPSAIMVDSSKSLRSLHTVSELSNIELKVIHLLKDVRSWAVSRRDLDIRNADRMYQEIRATAKRLARFRYHRRRNRFARFFIWYYGNRRIQEYVVQRNIDSLAVSYEELALQTEAALNSLATFLGCASHFPPFDSIVSKSHIALGNPMRHDPGKSSRIRYDYRWFWRRDWELPAICLPHIMRFNNQMVYKSPGANGLR